MGGAHSKLLSVYNVENEFKESETNYYYKVYNATVKETREKVSIFVHINEKEAVTSLLLKGLKTLKSIRHKSVLTFKESFNDNEGIYIVTSPVLSFKSMQDTFTEEDICFGLYTLLEALQFLDSAALTHVNISVEVLFISADDSRWRLGNPEFILPRDSVTPETLKKLHSDTDKLVVPKFDNANNESRVTACLVNMLVYSIFPALEKVHCLLDWKGLREACKNNISWKSWQNLEIFKDNHLIVVERELRNFRVKSDEDKLRMFVELPDHLKLISSVSRERFLSKLILDLDLFSENGAEALFSSYFSLTSPSTMTFEFIKSLFSSRRFEVRVNLLKIIPAVFEHVGHDFIFKTTIPEIVLGLEDENDEIYLGSLIALTTLLPVLLEGINTTPESKQAHDQRFDDLVETCISHSVRNLLSSPDFYFWEILEALRALLESILRLVIAKPLEKELSTFSKKLARSMHAVVQSMSGEQKVQFFTHGLVMEMHFHTANKGSVLWISKAIEFVTPYIRDENRAVRTVASECIVNWIKLISDLLDKGPSVSKTRVVEGFISRVKAAYPAVVREKKSFTKLLQKRQSFRNLPSAVPTPSQPIGVPNGRAASVEPDNDNSYEASSPSASSLGKSYVGRNLLHQQREAKFAESQTSLKISSPTILPHHNEDSFSATTIQSAISEIPIQPSSHTIFNNIDIPEMTEEYNEDL